MDSLVACYINQNKNQEITKHKREKEMGEEENDTRLDLRVLTDLHVPLLLLAPNLQGLMMTSSREIETRSLGLGGGGNR